MSLDIFLTRNEHSPTSFKSPGKLGLTKYVTLLDTSALHDDVTAEKQIRRIARTLVLVPGYRDIRGRKKFKKKNNILKSAASFERCTIVDVNGNEIVIC